MEKLLYVAGAIVAVGGALEVLRRVVRAMLRLLDDIREFLADWRGEPARAGVPERLGVMARLERIEHQVIPNGGNTDTTADRLVRVERATGADKH